MTVFYALAALIAVVWGTVFLTRGSLLGGGLVVLVVAAVFGYEFLHFEGGPMPLTLDRMLLPALVAAYAIQRWLGRVRPEPLGRAEWLLIAFLGLMFVSGCLAGWQIGASGIIGNAQPLVRLLFGYMVPFTLYWIARGARADEKQVAMVQAGVALLGVYLGVMGLLEISRQWWAVFPRHIADPTCGIHFGRARGPMVHAVRYGLWLSVCLLAAWTWRPRLPRVGQLALLAALPVMLAAVFFSYTRSVWLGFAGGAVIVLGLSLRGRWRPLVLGSVLGLGLIVALVGSDSLIGFRREQSAQETRHSASLRTSFAYVSWQMFLDRPLLGFGFGQFPKAKMPYLYDRNTELDLEFIRPLVHHNHFLCVLTETGLVGFGLFLAVLACWAARGWTLARCDDVPQYARTQGILLLGALAVWTAQLALHDLSFSVVDNSLIFFLAGLTMGMRAEPAVATAPVPRAEAAQPASPALGRLYYSG